MGSRLWRRLEVFAWKSTGLGAYGVNVAVADLDGIGTPEIIALGGNRVVAYRKVAGAIGYVEAASFALAGALDLVVADCDGDGVPEIYVLTGSYSGSSVYRLDTSLGRVGVFSLDSPAQSLHLEDLGSAHKNLVVGVGDYWSFSSVQPHLRAVDPRSGAEVWSSPVLWGSVPINSLSYVDANGDGAREMAFGTTYGMYVTR